MALFIRQDEDRSELQQKIAADLRERSQKRSIREGKPEDLADSDYLKNTKTTTSLMWLWILIVLVAIGILVWLTISSI